MTKNQSEETKIAVLGEKMDNMTKAITKLEGKLDTLSTVFVTQVQLTSAAEGLRDRINRLEKIVYGVIAFVSIEIGGLVFFALQNAIFK